MRLVTISDLEQPQHTKSLLIERAMQLGKWYHEFKKTDTEGYEYTVRIGGDRTRKPGIHASEISRCSRLLTYSVRGEQRIATESNHADANMRMRFSLGNAVHAMVQNEMRRMCARLGGAVSFHDEVKISWELGGVAAQWGVDSSCDGVFVFWIEVDGEALPYLRVGFEIKTKSGPEFEKLVKPDDDHMEQTCLYMAALDLPLMWVFYYNKSNSNWTSSEPPWLFQFDRHLWETTLQPRFGAVHQNAQTGELPPRQEGRHCGWCPYSWTCKPAILTAPQRGPSPVLKNPGALRVLR
jgi:hypothetical protein